MQKITFSLLAIFILLLPITIYSQTATAPKIEITEIGTFETSDEEWIEILNTTDASIDMTGWKFFENQTNHGLTAFRGDAVVDPGEYAIIANKADLFAQKYPQYVGTIMDSSWSGLNEDGEEIGIKDDTGNLVELFVYPQIEKVSGITSIERVDINIAGGEPTNWVRSIEPNSIGIAYTIPVPVPVPIPVPVPVPDVEPVEIPTVTLEEITEETETPPADVGTTTPEIAIETSNENLGPTTEEPPPVITPAPTQEPVSPQTVYIPINYPTTPQNSPPIAIIEIQSGELIAVGATTINFDGRASSDPDGDKLAFLWDLGDGNSATSANPGPHKYSKPGIYTVTLTVTDSYGAWEKTEQYVQVLEKTSIDKPSVGTSTANVKGTSSAATAKSTQKNTAKQQLTGIPDFIDSTLTINGYFVFVPTQEIKTVLNKQTATGAVKQKTETKSTSTGSTKKRTYFDGDISDSVRISELLPAPAAGEEEWVEIFNAGDKEVNLGNWDLSNKSKAKSPFVIPDTKTIPPNGYVVFPKSETKIALNNSGDTVVLRDFEGTVISTVVYEKSKPAESYGLVNIISSAVEVSNNSNNYTAKAVSNGQIKRSELKWEWIDSPTPGTENPVFEKLDGTVAMLIAGNESMDGNLSFDINLPDGSSKTIGFAENILNPVTAETVLTKGTNVSITAAKTADGFYELKKIDEVRPADQIPENNKNNYFIIWLIVVAVISGVAFAVRFYLVRKRNQLLINGAG